MRPENFVMGLGIESQFVYIIDFGNCKRYRNKKTGQHIPYKEHVESNYDPAFSSVNCHNKLQYSRRDDIESLLYMIIYMKNGKLPWMKIGDVLKIIILGKKESE
jgi:hypothetical protein